MARTSVAIERELVVTLAHATDDSVGGKARNLARLSSLGLAVPPAVVLTDAARRAFLDAGDLLGPIAALTEKLEGKSVTAVKCAAETIAALLCDSPLPMDVRSALDCQLLPLLPGPLIVRSSAMGEDSLAASFAGQLDSISDVIPGGQLHQAIVRVWASRWSARALAYEHARRVKLTGMGVIVQRQIDSRLSGVLFTRSPENDCHMLIEYCEGMGEALVSGRANPSRVAVRRSDLTVAGSTHTGTAESQLTGGQVEELAHAAMRVETAFGSPQDIEWTIDESGQLWFLQSRPITTSGRTRPQVHWSNANVNENFPEPITPLLYSLASAGYYHYFRNLGRAFGISRHRLARMEQPLRHIIGVHGARMYYNLSSIHSVLKSAPGGDLLAASFDQFVGSEPTDTPAASAFRNRRQRLVSQAIEIGVILARTTWQYARLTRRVESFEKTVAAFADGTTADRLRDRPLPELLEDFRAFLDIRCRRWNDAALADAGSMVCYGLLQRLLARAFPEADAAAQHNSLLKALPDLVSSKPAIELWALAQQVRSDPALADLFAAESPANVVRALRQEPRFCSFNQAFDRFLDEWGFRCSGELMLTVPSFQERPEALIDLIRAYVNAPSPVTLLREQAAARLEATSRVASAIRHRRVAWLLPRPLQPLIFRLVLAGAQKSIRLRERARLKQALLYSRLRRIVLEMGERLAGSGYLDRADDLFFLTTDEIDALVSGAAMFPRHVGALVSLRRQAHAEMSGLTPPDSLTLGVGEYYDGLDSPGAAVDGHGTAPVLRGLGACGGSATAPAAVLMDVTESHRLTPGAVLVTRQTDPGWGPIFPLVSGLVIERGGMLSHGAIIAREFGIPSVVGVKDATRVIAHGTRIRVDGDRGVVQIVASETARER